MEEGVMTERGWDQADAEEQTGDSYPYVYLWLHNRITWETESQATPKINEMGTSGVGSGIRSY